MEIVSKNKESIVDFARRVMGMADIMSNKVIRAFYQGRLTMVYPNDNLREVIGHIKFQTLFAKLDGLNLTK